MKVTERNLKDYFYLKERLEFAKQLQESIKINKKKGLIKNESMEEKKK